MATADGKPNVSAQQVKELRDRTGVGFAACREALVEATGDIERAIDLLRKKGQATAAKKAWITWTPAPTKFTRNRKAISWKGSRVMWWRPKKQPPQPCRPKTRRSLDSSGSSRFQMRLLELGGAVQLRAECVPNS